MANGCEKKNTCSHVFLRTEVGVKVEVAVWKNNDIYRPARHTVSLQIASLSPSTVAAWSAGRQKHNKGTLDMPEKP